MKKFATIVLVICVLIFLCLLAFADGPVIQVSPFMKPVLEAQNSAGAQTALGFTGNTTLQVITNTAMGAIKGVIPMSTGSGNYLWDMIPATNYAAGQLGISWALNGNVTNASAALWASAQIGMGSNTWGVPLNIFGGLQCIGMPYWYDLTNSTAAYHGGTPYGAGAGYFWGFGSNSASLGTVWASGTPGSGQAYQPYFNVINANPWGGGAAIDIRSGFTNSARGQWVGTDINGNKIYVPQYGFWNGQISDAYRPNGSANNGETEDSGQLGANVTIFNDTALSYYMTWNGQRSGDSFEGQIPGFMVDTTLGPNDFRFRVPRQVANVWMADTNGPGGIVPNTSWEDALLVDESSGDVSVYNNLTNGGDFFPGGSIHMNGSPAEVLFPGTGNSLYYYASSQALTISSGFFIQFNNNGLESAYFSNAGVLVLFSNLVVNQNIYESGTAYAKNLSVTNNANVGGTVSANAVITTNGIGSYALDNVGLAFSSTGVTNTSSVAYRIFHFTGNGVWITNLLTGWHVSFGNMYANGLSDSYILQPGEALIGSVCTEYTNAPF